MSKLEKKRIEKRKRKSNEPIVIRLNLSATMLIVILAIVAITTITAVEVITTVMSGEEKNVMAEEEEKNEHVVWVESSEIGEDGNPIKVPVPKGYSASQIEGETTVSGGFVIYEGDIDWNQVLAEETVETVETVETQSEVQSEAQDENAEQEEIKEGNSTEEVIQDQTEEALDGSIDEEKVEEPIESARNNETSTENEPIIEDKEVKNEISTDQNQKLENEENEQQGKESNVEEKQAETIKSEISEKAEENQTENTSKIETSNIKQLNEIEENAAEIEAQASEVVDEKIFELQKTVNQYVWVPIENIDEIYGVDENGKLWGKLYNYSGSGRTANNWEEVEGKINIKSATNYREPDVIRNLTNYDIDSQIPSYINEGTRYRMLAEEMEENYYEMIKSVEKYGGFYIGRYETGLVSEKAVVRKMETDINYQSWYKMYEKCKGLKGENENIKTSMIWGSLWDATLEWLVDVGAETTGGVKLTYREVGYDSKDFGNYYNTTFEYINTNGEVVVKEINTATLIPTGSAEYTKANNIYDMAGNVRELTLETVGSNIILRGGYYDYNISGPAGSRFNFFPNSVNPAFGCRTVLYVK